MRAYPSFDISKGSVYNLLDPVVQLFVMSLIKGVHIWCLHLGTPCTVWSQARHNIRNTLKARKREREGVALALFTAQTIRCCISNRVYFTLENPASSRLWGFGPIKDLFKCENIFFVTWDMCAFKMPHKKSTSLF